MTKNNATKWGDVIGRFLTHLQNEKYIITKQKKKEQKFSQP